VWCKCKARREVVGEGAQHKYGEEGKEFGSYDEMLEFYDALVKLYAI
jgi:hypothetical protein